jgi:hypothetical protein
MPKDNRSRGSKLGTHGGNRGGDQHKDDQPKKSSQSAGKDPHRGKKG